MLRFDSEPPHADVLFLQVDQGASDAWVVVGTTPCEVWIGPGFADDRVRIRFPDGRTEDIRLETDWEPEPRRTRIRNAQAVSGGILGIAALGANTLATAAFRAVGGAWLFIRGVRPDEEIWRFERTAYHIRQTPP